MNRWRFAVKSLVHGAIDWSGRPRRCRQQLRGKLIILTYHSFCTDWPRGLFNSLPIHRFERQVQFLKEQFKLVSLEQGVECLQQGVIDDKPWVAITIDDGFRDNYAHAWPVLQRYGVPATIFLATDFIDNNRPPWPTQLVEILERTPVRVMEAPFRADLKNLADRSLVARQLKKDWSPLPPLERFERLAALRKHLKVNEETHYPALTWDQVREMRKTGIHFGSHTVYHSILPAISDQIAKEEIRNSRQRLENELQEPCQIFAYPDGKYSDIVKNILVAQKFWLAMSQDSGINVKDSDLLVQKRIEIPFHDPMSSFRCRSSYALSPLNPIEIIL